MKICVHCNVEKPVDEFYRHPQMADGRLNKCKACQRQDVKDARARNAEHYKEYDRQRADLPERIEARKAYQRTSAYKASTGVAKKRYIERNPLKRVAHDAVNNALRDGKLQKQPCEACSSPESEAHHDDYSKPLEVRWLCDGCHKQHHKLERLKATAA